MQLLISLDGAVRAIYSEDIDLRSLGRPRIVRASHVEPDAEGRWLADLGPVDGPVLGPFGSRSEALDAETAIVGAPQDDGGGTDAGAFYVYYRDRSGLDGWGQVIKRTATVPGDSDRFGSAGSGAYRSDIARRGSAEKYRQF